MLQDYYDTYSAWIEFSKMKYSPMTWIAMGAGFTICTFLVSFVLSLMLIREVTLLPLAVGLATLVLFLGYPYMRKENIIESIEREFSDALKQMADTLKAGDTYEGALREVVDSDYGRLSEEMGLALRRLEDGENLETALNGFAQRVDSQLVKRTITIILDSIKTGASLADILDEIADDVRDFQHIKEDRKANTTMQFMFMIVSSAIIAPMIFGEITAVMSSFSNISMQIISEAQQAAAAQTSSFMLLLIQFYIILEVISSGTMMGLIREGKINKSVIYIPILLVVAFIMYYLASFGIRGMLGSA